MMSGKIIDGRYEIIEEVGRGGMAIVYRAKCLVLNRYVAIKVLRPEYRDDAEFIKRFKIEAQSAGSLSHPNIVSIYDVGIEDDIEYIVMEYVEGITLKQYLTAKGILQWKEAVDYASQICSGLEHAHKKGIVHKDIKPENIIITKEGILKITDFGIAKALNQGTIATGGLTMGSVHYFSPEQARGGFIDAKTDLYSLGILTYEMITGKLPFEGESAISVAMQHLESEPVKPSAFNPAIPKSLEVVILKAMKKEQTERYQTATQMLIDLKKVYVGSEVRFEDGNEYTKKFTPITPGVPPMTGGARPAGGATPAAGGAPRRPQPGTSAGARPPAKRPTTSSATPSEGAKKKKKKKVDTLTIVAGVFSAAAIIAIIICIYSFMFNGSKDEVNCPDLTGKTSAEALEYLKNDPNLKKIKLKTSNGATLSASDDGIIVNQNPKGIAIKKDSEIIVTLGDAEVDCPNLIDKTSNEALDILRNDPKLSKLTLKKLDGSFLTAADEGIIVEQSPKNTKIKSNGEITVTLKASTKTVRVPYVKGKTEDEATTMLQNARLNVRVETQSSTSVESGYVISSSPAGGKDVKEGTEVKIYVSSGKTNDNDSEYVDVPDVRNKTLEEAKSALERAGLSLGEVKQVESNTYRKGRVVSQSEKSGNRVKRGTAVSLEVSTGSSDNSSAEPSASAKPSGTPTNPFTDPQKTATPKPSASPDRSNNNQNEEDNND